MQTTTIAARNATLAKLIGLSIRRELRQARRIALSDRLGTAGTYELTPGYCERAVRSLTGPVLMAAAVNMGVPADDLTLLAISAENEANFLFNRAVEVVLERITARTAHIDAIPDTD